MRNICEFTMNAIFIPYTTYHIPYTIYQNGPTEQNIMNILFRKMALDDPIFILVVGFHLFWTAFDLLVTVVPLKMALGLQKNYFWAFQKNNHTSVCQVNPHDFF